jgi:hypothetical protein
MQRQHAEEYLRLEHEAITRLRNGVSHKNYCRKLQALVLPSFEDCCSYELFAMSRATSPALAVKTVWKRNVDTAKFQTPVARLKHGIGTQLAPTIELSENTIPENLLNTLLERAALLTLPPAAPSKHFGIDGVSYEVSFNNSFAWSRFRWWQEPPAGWEPLQKLFHEIEELVCREVS